MKEKPLFITIHGIDGTGKTTTTENVTHALQERGKMVVNYDQYESEHGTNPFSGAKKRVLTETSPTAQLAYYLGSTMYHSDRIEALIDDGYYVLKSRYLDDVLAHHAQLGVENVQEIASLFPIIQPDLRVILTLSEEVRRERIIVRGEMDEKDKEVRVTGSRLDFFENYLLSVNKDLVAIGKALQIDTTDIEPDQVATSIIDHLLTEGMLSQEEDYE